MRDFTVLLIFVLVSSHSSCWIFASTHVASGVVFVVAVVVLVGVVVVAVAVVVAGSFAFIILFVVSDLSSSRLLSGCVVLAVVLRIIQENYERQNQQRLEMNRVKEIAHRWC